MDHNQQPVMGSPQNNMMADQQPSSMGHNHANAYEKSGALPNKWLSGLFDCFSPISLCCLTCWCPCVVFGKIRAREQGEKDPSGVNSSCAIHCLGLYCAFAPILQCMNRGDMRKKYGIEGDGFTDCLLACCCGCCELIQEEKESLIRQTGIDPKTEQPYVAPTGMNYA